jgi:hypothetical protein
VLLGATILALKLRGRVREARAIHEAAREHELGSAA